MEKVWLSSTYYMDPKLAGCNASVERMFTRLLAYAGNAETRGLLPENVHILVGIPRGKDAVSELVRRKVLHALDKGGYRFANWSHWQESGDKLLEQRAKDRDRKRRKRAEQPEMSADTSADVHPHIREEKRREEVSGQVSTSPQVSNGGASQTHEPTGPRVPIDGWTLIRGIPGIGPLPQATKTALALKASELLHAGSSERHVRDALDLWMAKPDAGPGLLPHLVAEVIKSETAPTGRGGGAVNAHDAKVSSYLEAAQRLTGRPSTFTARKGLA